MRVLVTGHRGYIGSVLTTILRHGRFEVVGVDRDQCPGFTFGRCRPSVPEFCTDLRDLGFADLLSFDAVVHLASAPDANERCSHRQEAARINEASTAHLVEACKRADVPHFVHVSSGDVYGSSGGDAISECAAAAPSSASGASALRCERIVQRGADQHFCPTILRIPEVYGVSPRLHFDGLINDFVASGVAGGVVRIPRNGRIRRSFIHIEDACRAVAALLAATPDAAGEVFNVVDARGAASPFDVADLIDERRLGCRRVAADVTATGLGYVLDGTKFASALPKFRFRWTPALGVGQLCRALLNAGFTPGQYAAAKLARGDRAVSVGANTSPAAIVARRDHHAA